MALSAEYYRLAADDCHPEAGLNYHRCLCLLGNWDGSD
jgi:hypothetical protein